MTISAATIKHKNINFKHKTTAPFLFIKGQLRLYLSICFHLYATVDTILKMKVNTLVTIYKYIFNFQLCTYHLSLVVHNATLE